MPPSSARIEAAARGSSVSRQTLPIGETGKYINGFAFKSTDWEDNGLPIIRIQNLTDPTKPMNRTTRDVGPSFLVQPGDLLVSWSATLDAFIWNREPALLNQHIFKVVPDTNLVLRKYLFYSLRRAIAEMVKSEHLHGSTMKHINRGPFLSHRIDVPSFALQEEIVAEIEKQLSRLDDAVANLEGVKANLKRYKAAVLKAAVGGQLSANEAVAASAEGRPYEAATDLLERMRLERRTFWPNDRYLEPLTIDVRALPALPTGWTWCLSDAVFTFITSGSRGWAKFYSETGAAFLRVGNLEHENIKLDLSELQRVTPPNGAEGQRTAVRAGDILISITADVGMVGLVPENFEAAYINQHVALLRPVPSVNARYLAYFLSSQYGGWGQLKKLQKGATKPGLTLEDLRSIFVPLPPLAEQRRIADEIERRLSFVDTTNVIVDRIARRAVILRAAVLEFAFAGRVATQQLANEERIPLVQEVPKEQMSGARKPNQGLEKDFMSSTAAETLQQLLEAIDQLGGEAAPEKLLEAARLQDNVDKFFDLVREGRNSGALEVPVGVGGSVRRKRNAS